MSKKSKKEKKAPAEPELGKRPAPKVPKERSLLCTILTILLVLVGIGELALLGYIGLLARQGAQNRQSYAQPTAQPSGGSARSGAGSYAGPWLMVENGTVTWEWEEGRPIGLRQPSEQPQEEEKRLSRLTAAVIPYELADMGGSDEAEPPVRTEGDTQTPV